MKRVVLFVITNLAIILALGVALSLFGVSRILDEQGVGLEVIGDRLGLPVQRGALMADEIINNTNTTSEEIGKQVDEQFTDKVSIWKEKHLLALEVLENTKARLARTMAQKGQAQKNDSLTYCDPGGTEGLPP